MSARKGYFLLALAVLALDQVTKIAVDAVLRTRGPVEIVPGFFNLWYSRNRGGLFGYFQNLPDPWRALLLTLLPVLIVGAIGWYLAKAPDSSRLTLGGLALILGGAVGNLVDRVFRGEVIDFLDVYASSRSLEERLVARFGTAHWPTFNVADSAIVVGACLLILDVLRPAGRRETVTGGSPDAPGSIGP
jgi:signal peptidase II